jgi:hypothetical protein
VVADPIQARLMNENKPAVIIPDRDCLRPLKGHEVVRRGDFVSDNHQGFIPWAGPSGFQAGSFVDQIYRPRKSPLAEARMQK